MYIYYTKRIETALDCGVCFKPCTPRSTVPYFAGTYTKAIHWKCLRDFFAKELAKVDKEMDSRLQGYGRRKKYLYPNGL